MSDTWLLFVSLEEDLEEIRVLSATVKYSESVHDQIDEIIVEYPTLDSTQLAISRIEEITKRK